MNIVTKFDLKQLVYAIANEHKLVWRPCPSCNETGQLCGADGIALHCPRCGGHKGKWENLPTQWRLSGRGPILTIVLIEGKVTDNGTEIQYMAQETGCPAGTMWDQENLFATIEEARAECDRRNTEADLAAANVAPHVDTACPSGLTEEGAASQPGQLPTFPVTFSKTFTILLQAPDRETAKEAIDNVDEYDLDYEWEVPDWEREVGIPCALAPECMVNDDGDIDPVGTRDDVAASNFAPHVPTTCPGDLAAKEVG